MKLKNLFKRLFKIENDGFVRIVKKTGRKYYVITIRYDSSEASHKEFMTATGAIDEADSYDWKYFIDADIAGIDDLLLGKSKK